MRGEGYVPLGLPPPPEERGEHPPIRIDAIPQTRFL
jgi:hypothetical protein